MDLYPAIDIEGGHVARSRAGNHVRNSSSGTDPLIQARAFVSAGARWLHVVDLDRAFETGSSNDAVVRDICGVSGVAVQVGGNLGSLDVAGALVAAGARRVVLGTAVALAPDGLARFITRLAPAVLALSLDVRNGRCVVRGTRHDPRGGRSVVSGDPTPLDVLPARLVERALEAGIETIVYRDIGRDGRLAGADLAGAERVARIGARVIVAGGVRGLDEILEAKRLRLAGMIVGRALYDGLFTLEEALACLS